MVVLRKMHNRGRRIAILRSPVTTIVQLFWTTHSYRTSVWEVNFKYGWSLTTWRPIINSKRKHQRGTRDREESEAWRRAWGTNKRRIFKSHILITRFNRNNTNHCKGVIDHLSKRTSNWTTTTDWVVTMRRKYKWSRPVVWIDSCPIHVWYQEITTMFHGTLKCVVSKSTIIPVSLVHLYIREVFDVCAVVSRKMLCVTQEQLIDCCVLAGCDYVKSLKDISFIKVVGLIRQHGN